MVQVWVSLESQQFRWYGFNVARTQKRVFVTPAAFSDMFPISFLLTYILMLLLTGQRAASRRNGW